jgi:PPM family protein phosphatase
VSATALDACGKTHKGKVRVGNEDAMLVDAEIGLYAVLDGMGGAKAGEIASGTARDVLGEYVRGNLDRAASRKELLHAAIHAANARVHHDARHHREWRGMGTTVVAFLLVDSENAIIAHVGDSRAYLWRDGRMQLLTRDHTVVAELLRRNMITASEATHHPHRNVLSRNLGSKPAVKVDVVELALKPGDRILLCSDGLTGFASSDAIEQILGSHDPVEDTADDLIDLAMRGGGRDNITAVVIDTDRAEVPRHTQILRTSGSVAWWRRRELFIEAARRRGLCDSPVCSVLSPDEALEIVAGNLSEAMFHDLEQTSGINVWTYAENLGRGWFDQDGDYDILRDLLDILRAAADEVLADIESSGEPYAMSLDIAVTRALIVAEVAIGGLLSERLRAVEAELLELGVRQSGRIDTSVVQPFADQPTQPYLKTVRVDPPPPEMQSCLEQALVLARDMLSHDVAGEDAADCLVRAHQAALEPVGPSDAELSARDLVAVRGSDESGITPLLDALDRARIVHLDAIKRLDATPDLRAAALRRVAMAHRRLMYSVASIVVENTQPVTQALHAAAARTAKLRAQVGKGEAQLAEIERKQASRKTVPNLSRSQS